KPKRRHNTYHGDTETRRYTEKNQTCSTAKDAKDAEEHCRNLIEETRISHSPRPGYAACFEKTRFFEPLLRRHFKDDSLRVRDITLLTTGSDHSIIGELTSWRQRQRTGLFHYRLALEQNNAHTKLDVM